MQTLAVNDVLSSENTEKSLEINSHNQVDIQL